MNIALPNIIPKLRDHTNPVNEIASNFFRTEYAVHDKSMHIKIFEKSSVWPIHLTLLEYPTPPANQFHFHISSIVKTNKVWTAISTNVFECDITKFDNMPIDDHCYVAVRFPKPIEVVNFISSIAVLLEHSHQFLIGFIVNSLDMRLFTPNGYAVD